MLLIGYIGGFVILGLVAYAITSLADKRGSGLLWGIGYLVFPWLFGAWLVGGVILSLVI